MNRYASRFGSPAPRLYLRCVRVPRSRGSHRRNIRRNAGAPQVLPSSPNQLRPSGYEQPHCVRDDTDSHNFGRPMCPQRHLEKPSRRNRSQPSPIDEVQLYELSDAMFGLTALSMSQASICGVRALLSGSGPAVALSLMPPSVAKCRCVRSCIPVRRRTFPRIERRLLLV
jgi:hypothetical protein